MKFPVVLVTVGVVNVYVNGAVPPVGATDKLPVDAQKVYRVALSDFLLTGGEANMGFLTKDNKEIEKVFPPATGTNDPRSDIRLAIIQYLSQ